MANCLASFDANLPPPCINIFAAGGRSDSAPMPGSGGLSDVKSFKNEESFLHHQ